MSLLEVITSIECSLRLRAQSSNEVESCIYMSNILKLIETVSPLKNE